jgi:hypothetical protein
MGRVKTYYHDFIGGEFENVPAEYQLTAEEIYELELDYINEQLRLVADQDSKLDIYLD